MASGSLSDIGRAGPDPGRLLRHCGHGGIGHRIGNGPFSGGLPRDHRDGVGDAPGQVHHRSTAPAEEQAGPDGLGRHHRRVGHAVEAAVQGGRGFGPQPSHQAHRLVQTGHPIDASIEGDAGGGEVGFDVAGAEPQFQPAAGDPLHRGRRFRRDDRVPQRDVEHQRAEADPVRDRSDGGQRGQRLPLRDDDVVGEGDVGESELLVALHTLPPPIDRQFPEVQPEAERTDHLRIVPTSFPSIGFHAVGPMHRTAPPGPGLRGGPPLAR